MSLLPNNGGNITTAAAATTTTTLAASNEAVTKGSPASLLPLNHNHPFLVLPDDVLHTLFTHLLLLTPPPLLHTNNRQGQGGESQRHWLAACLAVNRAWLAAGLPLLWKRIDCFSDDWDALKHLLMLSSSSTSNNFNSATTTTTTTAAAASLVNNTTSSQSRKLLSQPSSSSSPSSTTYSTSTSSPTTSPTSTSNNHLSLSTPTTARTSHNSNSIRRPLDIDYRTYIQSLHLIPSSSQWILGDLRPTSLRRAIQACHRLTSLSLDCPAINDDDIWVLTRACPHLMDLSLVSAPMEYARITDEGLAAIAGNCKGIRHIRLKSTWLHYRPSSCSNIDRGGGGGSDISPYRSSFSSSGTSSSRSITPPPPLAAILPRIPSSPSISSLSASVMSSSLLSSSSSSLATGVNTTVTTTTAVAAVTQLSSSLPFSPSSASAPAFINSNNAPLPTSSVSSSASVNGVSVTTTPASSTPTAAGLSTGSVSEILHPPLYHQHQSYSYSSSSSHMPLYGIPSSASSTLLFDAATAYTSFTDRGIRKLADAFEGRLLTFGLEWVGGGGGGGYGQEHQQQHHQVSSSSPPNHHVSLPVLSLAATSSSPSAFTAMTPTNSSSGSSSSSSSNAVTPSSSPLPPPISTTTTALSSSTTSFSATTPASSNTTLTPSSSTPTSSSSASQKMVNALRDLIARNPSLHTLALDWPIPLDPVLVAAAETCRKLRVLRVGNVEKMDALGKCVRANRGLRVVALYEINSTLDCVGIIKELGNGGNNWNSGGGGVDFLSDLMANTSLTSSLPPPVLPPQSQLPPPPFADDNYNEYLNNNNNWEEDGDENGDEDVRRLDYDYDDHDDDDDSDSWSYSSTVSSSSSSTDVNAAPSGGGSSQQQRSSSSSSSSSRQQHGHRRRRLRISHRRAHLRELELDGVGFLRTLLPHLTQFSHLTRLKLYPSRRAASFFANDDLVADILRHTPRLQHLDVPILGDGPIARAAEACPLLEYFDLVSGRDVTDSALILLVKRCQRLAHVRLGSAPLISDNAMIVLARSLALNLKRLVCPFGNVRLTTRTLEALGRHCGRLEGLGNVPAAIDFNALMFHLPKLTRLLVVGLCVMPPTVGGGGGVGGNGSALLLPTPVSASSPSSSSSSPSFGGGSGSNGGGVGINTGSGGHESRQFGCSAQLPLSLSPASRAFGLVKEDQDRLKASCKRLKHIIISF